MVDWVGSLGKIRKLYLVVLSPAWGPVGREVDLKRLEPSVDQMNQVASLGSTHQRAAVAFPKSDSWYSRTTEQVEYWRMTKSMGSKVLLLRRKRWGVFVAVRV